MAETTLGRGLGALLPSGGDDLPPEEGEAQFFICHVDRIIPNPDQPRREIDPAALRELADSIREQGVLQPLLVRRLADGTLQIIAGERRWRAAKLAGVHEVPVVVREVSNDADQLELALIENVQRQDLDPIEEALSYQRLVDLRGLTQEQVARKVGKDRSTVANALRLLTLPAEIRDDISQGRLSPGHGRALLRLADQPRALMELRQQILAKGLSVRQAEELARKLKNAPTSPAPGQRPQPVIPAAHCARLCASLEQRLGAKARIIQKGEQGKLVIEYSSPKELERLLGQILASSGGSGD